MAINYAAAGVNIAAGNEAVQRIKAAVQSTFNSAVLTPLGGFGSLYDLKNILHQYEHPVLVQSIDGVGTKMMIARMMQKFDTIGIDLVSATANDIAVLGAKPITLLDYIANDKLNPAIVEQIVTGMAAACVQHEIALVGGETAEMPGTYLPGEHDLVGIITGIVEKDKAILGSHIAAGDQVFAIPSSGLHTNGYSLARKLLFEVQHYSVNTQLPGFTESLGDVLLTPHLNYTPLIQHWLAQNIELKGMAHITGGGVLENIPRILPPGLDVTIQRNACPIPPIFTVLQKISQLPAHELYRTFNMGMGLIVIVAKDEVAKFLQSTQTLNQFSIYSVGEVIVGQNEVRLI